MKYKQPRPVLSPVLSRVIAREMLGKQEVGHSQKLSMSELKRAERSFRGYHREKWLAQIFRL